MTIATQDTASGGRIWNRQDLWLDIYGRFGLRLPHKRFTPGHSTPFDFVYEAISDPSRDLAAWANRSGLKTLCASIIAALEFRFSDDPLRGRVLSGSEDQAKNLYEYWREWAYKVLPDRLRSEPGRLVTHLDNGDFEILAASQKRVRGAKVQRLYRDEVDEIDPDIIAASVGMLASINGTPARTIETSTWHYVGGPMARLVADAAQSGISLHKWNVWESIERCPTSRHDNGRSCAGCKLNPVCVSKAREYHRDPERRLGIASECGGLMAIDDAIKQLSHWSKEQWDAEAECKRPSLEGMVYAGFDRTKHVKADLDFNDALPIYRAIDWGLNNFVCLWIQCDKAGKVYIVDEYWAENATVADNAKELNRRDKDCTIEATYCDPAGTSRSDQTGYSDVEVFKSLGIPCTFTRAPWATNVHNGIQLIRSFLQPAVGAPRLFVAGRCQRMLTAFESYRLRKVNNEYIDEPIYPQPLDHGPSAFRYFMVNRFGKAQASAGYMRYA